MSSRVAFYADRTSTLLLANSRARTVCGFEPCSCVRRGNVPAGSDAAAFAGSGRVRAADRCRHRAMFIAERFSGSVNARGACVAEGVASRRRAAERGRAAGAVEARQPPSSTLGLTAATPGWRWRRRRQTSTGESDHRRPPRADDRRSRRDTRPLGPRGASRPRDRRPGRWGQGEAAVTTANARRCCGEGRARVGPVRRRQDDGSA